MRLRHVVGGVLVLALAGAAGFAVLAYESAIDPVSRPERSAFDTAAIARGAELAAIGNCIVCHTAPGGAVLAGGLPIATPFGTIHSTNITPDPETGIGRWSEAAFARSMREGVDRDGRHLYPAFPYDHFTRVTDDDNRALYAYLMTRPPVHAPERPNELAFPFNLRPLLAGWKLFVSARGTARRRSRAERRVEPRRLSGRGARPLRRLPHAAQPPRRRAARRAFRRRRG